MNAAIRDGDVGRYMAANHAFHFAIYRAAGAEVLLSLADSLWLQIGPFMRVVFGRVGAQSLEIDHHVETLAALKARDPEAARRAMAADIAMGMAAMRAAVA